jgi:hypothetical protein
MKNIVVFGDSWPHGAELDATEQPYGEILGQRLGVKVWNRSHPGSSITHLIEQLRSFIHKSRSPNQNIELDNTMALFFLTAAERDLLWHPDGGCYHLSPGYPPDAWWYRQAHSDQLVDFRVNTTLIALQAMCQKHGLQDFYLWGWQTRNLWPEVDLAKFVGRGQITAIDDFFEPWPEISDRHSRLGWLIQHKNTNIWPKLRHPNQQGHEKIANLWYDFLTSQNDVHRI